MKHISKLQIKILKKVFEYNKKNFSEASFFCPSSFSIGFYQMKLWINKKNIFKFILAFIKEIFAIVLANNYEVKGNIKNLKNFKNIVITFGNDASIKKKLYIDKYFNYSSKDSSVLWVVIFSGKKIFYNNNVISIVKKKTNFIYKIKNFIFYFVKLFFEKKNLHKLTNNHFTSKKLEKIFNTILKKKVIKNSKIFFPYESQPFQNNLIKNIKSLDKKIKIIGYVHSYPAFPSRLMKKNINPDCLIVNSRDQIYSFTKFLNWKKKEIIFLPSVRFKKRNLNDLSSKIFLPIDFNSIEHICNSIKDLSKIYNLKKFKIQNHPESINSKKHIRLIYKINQIIYKVGSSQLITKTPIFIGSTGAIIESLNHGFEPIHIMEDLEFEIYSQTLWPSIKSHFIDNNIVEYKLIKKNIVSIQKNFLFDRYLKMN